MGRAEVDVQNYMDESPSLTHWKSQQDADPTALTLIMMPFLGGSWGEWSQVIASLSPRTRCVGLDLPGFGEAAEITGYSIVDMAEYVIDRVKSLKLRGFMLVGHSMAGKVAMVVASQAKDRPELSGLSGLVLVAPSPLSPEPIDDEKRAKMKATLGKPGMSYRKHAEDYIRENASSELPPHVFEQAVGDILRMNCQAWTAWLDKGSKEDWAERVGDLKVYSLVVAGENDEALGPKVQERLVVPHLLRSQFCVVSRAGHLIPMERPLQLAKLIADFVDGVATAERTIIPVKELDPEYKALIESDRVSSTTRAALLDRLGPAEKPVSKRGLEQDAVKTLQMIAECVVPLTGRFIDFGAQMNARLAAGKGKGWRYSELPPDPKAYSAAIKTIDRFCLNTFDASFVDLQIEKQIETLTLTQRGELITTLFDSGSDTSILDAAQMRRWFEDLRGDVTALYMAHPETLAQVGYSGIADGAKSNSLSGFVELGLGKVESWEPKAKGMSK